MQTFKPKSAAGTAVAPAREPEALDVALSPCADADSFCLELSKIFHVRRTEVALLQLEKGLLRFLFPEELKTAGSIPVSSATAVAAHTAVTKKVELFNSFTKVKHASIFENVKFANPNESDPGERAPIQKLMSAPVLTSEGTVLGVLQVCRKGLDLRMAGADFTPDDLQVLENAAKVAAKGAFIRQT
jgi:hypothetical protein